MQLSLDENNLRKGWSNKFDYWFNPKDYTVSNVSELPTNNGDDMSHSAYLISVGYIPYFTINEEEVVKHFIEQMDNKKLKNVFAGLKGEKLKDTFWKYFNAYQELNEKYSDFESDFLIEKAESWCKENSVSYKVVK